MNISFTQEMVKSSFWLVVYRIFVNLLRVATLGILARNLSPADFGIAALSQVLLNFIILGQQNSDGVASYVIYDQRHMGNGANSAFWLNLFLSTILSFILLLSIPIIKKIYSYNELPMILLILIIVFFVKRISLIPEALMRRTMQFKKLVLRDVVVDISISFLSILLAVLGWGVYSLILPQLLAEIIRLILTLFLAHWLPRLKLDIQEWKSIWKYTAPVMGSSTLMIALNDGDTLIIGKIFDSISLGFYNMAWQLSNIVGRNVTAVVTTTSFSALSLLNKDNERLKTAYQRIIHVLGIITVPLLVGLFALAEDTILLIYGANWLNITALVRIFIIFTIIRVFTSPSGSIFTAIGRPEVGFKLALAILPFYLLSILIFSKWGVIGVATAVVVTRLFGAFASYIMANRLLHLPALAGLSEMLRVFLISCAVGVAAYLFNNWFLTININLVGRMILCIVLGGVFYIFGLLFFKRDGYKEIVTVTSQLSPYLALQLTRLSKLNYRYAEKY